MGVCYIFYGPVYKNSIYFRASFFFSLFYAARDLKIGAVGEESRLFLSPASMLNILCVNKII